MADVAVVLLDGEGQVFAGEGLILGNEAMKAPLVIRDERAAFHPGFVEVLLTGWIIAPAQTQAKVRRWTGSNARQSHGFSVFF